MRVIAYEPTIEAHVPIPIKTTAIPKPYVARTPYAIALAKLKPTESFRFPYIDEQSVRYFAKRLAIKITCMVEDWDVENPNARRFTRCWRIDPDRV